MEHNEVQCKEILQEIGVLLRDEFIAVFEEQKGAIIMRLLSGKAYRITVSEA